MGVEAVGVLHDELAAAQEAEAWADLVAELRPGSGRASADSSLYERSSLRTRAVTASSWVGPRADLVVVTVGEAHELGAVVVPTAALAPQLARLQRGHHASPVRPWRPFPRARSAPPSRAPSAPAAETRTRPTPSCVSCRPACSRRWLAISASAGSSFNVGAYIRLMCITFVIAFLSPPSTRPRCRPRRPCGRLLPERTPRPTRPRTPRRCRRRPPRRGRSPRIP